MLALRIMNLGTESQWDLRREIGALAPNGLELSRMASPRILSNARPDSGLARVGRRSLERSVRGSNELLGSRRLGSPIHGISCNMK
jgi:hypothetical protein